MTTGLTSRQTQILKAIVEEYIAIAGAVGSSSLEKKYNLGVSPATIRSEMAALTKMKYLKQPHTSSGRVPTSNAMKFYINQLMEEKQLGVAEEVKAKEQVWDARNNFDKFMEEATQALADKTKALTIAATEDGEVWRSGFSHVYEDPEFFEAPLVCQSIFSFLDEENILHQIFFERLTGLSPIEILFGEELGLRNFSPIGIVASRFSVKGKNGAIAVVGSFRRTPSVIPNVRFIGSLIQELMA